MKGKKNIVVQVWLIKRCLFLISLFFLLASNLKAQETYTRKITVSEWIDEMLKCNDSIYIIKNTEIYYDKNTDKGCCLSLIDEFEQNKKQKIERHIKPTVLIANCKFEKYLTFIIPNLIFHENVTFMGSKGMNQCIFYNCTFKQGLDFRSTELGKPDFRKCTIQQRVVICDLECSSLSFNECLFKIVNSHVNSIFSFGDEMCERNYQYMFRVYQINNNRIRSFEMNDCIITTDNTTAVLLFEGGSYDEIFISNIDFSDAIVDFTQCSVEKTFYISNCVFKKPLGATLFNLPKENTNVLWSQLDSVGIANYVLQGKEYAPYIAVADTQVNNTENYNELIGSYRKFYNSYKYRGDIESANACYIKMKDIETHRKHFLYQNDSSLKNWFNWRLNRFLKKFCEYGTSPVLALIMSMWTILGFAVYYFFVYSEWDKINLGFLIGRYRRLMEYFNSEKTLEDYYKSIYKDKVKLYSDYKAELEVNKAYIPFFIRLLGDPLYYLFYLRHRIIGKLYRNAEILKGRWVDLKPFRKVLVGAFFTGFILIYLASILVMRALNSTILSINTFSTLGFGSIPVKGLSRYITIIEGFLGWFLLSIFSVSLISQIIQN